MRQNFKAVPEQDELYPLSVQLKGETWHVFDARSGGYGADAYDTYAEADAAARELKEAWF